MEEYKQIGLKIYKLCSGGIKNGAGIDLLCIGTDRATGDCLGPLVGSMVKHSLLHLSSFHGVRIFGTLKKPLHAANLVDTVKLLEKRKAERLHIAIDACLGSEENVGKINVGKGPILPGASLKKDLPAVGDIFITGIVNTYNTDNGCDILSHRVILQSTRLSFIMQMSKIIADGIMLALKMLLLTYPQEYGIINEPSEKYINI